MLNGIDQFFGSGRRTVLGTVFPSGINNGLQLLSHGVAVRSEIEQIERYGLPLPGIPEVVRPKPCEYDPDPG